MFCPPPPFRRMHKNRNVRAARLIDDFASPQRLHINPYVYACKQPLRSKAILILIGKYMPIPTAQAINNIDYPDEKPERRLSCPKPADYPYMYRLFFISTNNMSISFGDDCRNGVLVDQPLTPLLLRAPQHNLKPYVPLN